jgi:hypothetical protein
LGPHRDSGADGRSRAEFIEGALAGFASLFQSVFELARVIPAGVLFSNSTARPNWIPIYGDDRKIEVIPPHPPKVALFFQQVRYQDIDFIAQRTGKLDIHAWRIAIEDWRDREDFTRLHADPT